MKAWIPIIALCAAIAAAGCGGSDSSSGEEKASVPQTKPTVTLPKGPPPKKLVVEEVEEGTGARAVKPGDEVTVQWVGFFYKNGKEFFSSWKDRNSFTFLTGAGRVIPGWDRGMVGMRVGGRRKLIIPPRLAYEDTGTTSVPPNETLVYVVDLLAIK